MDINALQYVVGEVKAIHQTISSDNPYVDIKYSEYIQIDKK